MSVIDIPNSRGTAEYADAHVYPLRRTMTVALDPAEELLTLYAGPIHGDEYADLLLVDDPTDEQLARMTEIEKQQEELQDRYVSAWAYAASELAESRLITLNVNLGGSEDDGDLAADFRKEINSLIHVTRDERGGWKVHF